MVLAFCKSSHILVPMYVVLPIQCMCWAILNCMHSYIHLINKVNINYMCVFSYRNTNVTIYALQNGSFFSPDNLTNLIETNRGTLSNIFGYDIVTISSNNVTPQPPSATEPPERTEDHSIPSWAIALIVIVSSVIIVSVLLIILAILWRRYTR